MFSQFAPDGGNPLGVANLVLGHRRCPAVNAIEQGLRIEIEDIPKLLPDQGDDFLIALIENPRV